MNWIRISPLFIILLVSAVLLPACTSADETEPTEPATATAVPATETAAPVPATIEEATPQQVTQSFYEWYLGFTADRGDGSFTNPLVEGLYRNSEYLTARFVADIDETLAGFEVAGFDPILLAQDVPVSFEVPEATADSAAADTDATTVAVHFYWGGNPDPSVRMVHLVRQDGRWLIDDVTAEEPAAAAPAAPETPEGVTAAFYDWYLAHIGDPASDDFRNPMVDKAYHDAPYLTESFVGYVDELLAGFQGGGYDPFLCAQAIPTHVTPELAFVRGETASVVVFSSFPNQRVTVDLRPEGDSWVITNITCANDPAGVATAFYTWYLGYIRSGAEGEPRNPLVDKAYRDHPLLAEALVEEVDQLLEGFDQGGYDPFLLAQDIPQNFTVDPGVIENTAVVHLKFGPDSVRHLLITIDERRDIIAISDAEAPSDEAPSDEAPESDQPLETDAGLLTDERFAFSFAYPADWVVVSETVAGPGVPDDWPVQALWLVMPPDVAEALQSASGPPDPDAPVIVPPFQVEAVVGDEQAMERVYPDFAAATSAEFSGNDALIVRVDPGYTHIIFPHPTQPDTWIVFTDWVTEFPGREVQAEVAAPVWLAMLRSVQFGP